MKELIEKRNDLQDKMEAILNTAKAESRAITAEEKTKFETFKAQVDELDETIKIEETVTNMKKREFKEAAPVAKLEEKAFADFLRGVVNADAPIKKGDNGALIPQTIANKIIDKVEQICPIYAMAEKYNVKGTLSIPYVDTDSTTLAMSYADEFVEPDSTTLKTTSIEMTGYLAEALTKVSKSLVNNSDFDIVSFVVTQVAKKVAKFIEGELLKGTSLKITGLSDIKTEVVASSATTITADELIDLQESVIDEHQADACWIMNRATRKAIRKLKDGDGNYLLNRDFTAKWNYTLLGKPVYCSDNMPMMAAGEDIIYYGDMSGLAVKLSEAINTQVLMERYAPQHAIGVLAFVEVDAKVQDQQKLAKLTMKSA